MRNITNTVFTKYFDVSVKGYFFHINSLTCSKFKNSIKDEV